MKNLYLIIAVLISINTFGQIQQNINKTTGTESKNITEIDSIRFNANQTEMEIILQNGTVQNHSLSTINNVTFSGELVGSITSLDCAGAIVSGTLIDGVSAIGVSFTVNYAGSNGGTYDAQNISSTGVFGLTASLSPGSFNINGGSLTFTVTGTPNGSGIASFTLSIGGETCNFDILVDAATISSIDCANAISIGTLVEGELANAISAVIDYVGGNGGAYVAQNISSTGVLGLTANLSAGSFALGNGSLNYTISGVPNSSGTASFEIAIGGEFCVLELLVLPIGSISSLNCAGAITNGSVVAGVTTNGVTVEIQYTGGNGGVHNGQIVNSSGVNGLTATLTAGNFINGDSSLIYTINGTPSASGTASFLLSVGGQLCTLNVIVNPGAISSLNCSSAINNGTLTAGIVASGVSSSVPYSGGNLGIHNGQVVSSTGVTGLTANLSAGNFANGNGTLNYTITGIPSGAGTASFALNIGGKSCTLNRTVGAPVYPSGTIHCSGATSIVNVINPSTGRTWMDRNLGAFTVATSSTHTNSYGDLYQWGRRADGHQCRNSSTTSSLSSSDQPAHGSFILVPNSPFDWRSPQNSNLWQGVNGINNPCPSGYRLPTESEFNTERLSWSTNNASGAFASPLKLTLAGARSNSNGALSSVGTFGGYWTSTGNTSISRSLGIFSFDAVIGNRYKAEGGSVRCIKN